MAVSLTLHNLTVSYEPGVAAVDGLDLTVKDSERLVLLGPSGCGKTTTLRAIAGLLDPTSGDVLFDDESMRNVPAEKRGAVMVGQEPALFPFKTVADNVTFGLKLQKFPSAQRAERVREALASVALDGFEHRFPEELSGGQRQRVALARALAVRPRVLLLDEPLSSTDPELRAELRDVICRVQRDNSITTVMVTHDQREAVEMGDRIALMIDGRLRQVGSPESFYEQPVDIDVARFFGSANVLSGIKTGNTVQTSIGPVHTTVSSLPDGPVLVTIRPDVVEQKTAATNCFRALVDESRYVGIAFDCEARIGETGVRFFAAPNSEQPAPGSSVTLHFPPEHVRVLPIENPTAASASEAAGI